MAAPVAARLAAGKAATNPPLVTLECPECRARVHTVAGCEAWCPHFRGSKQMVVVPKR